MPTVNGQTFFPFDNAGITPSDDVVNDTQEITAGVWSGGAGTLLTLFTSSVQTASSGQYYIDVYNVATSSTTTTPEVQFSVAYGHKWGSGSLTLNEQYPSRAIFSQYKNILLDPADEYFTIGGFNRDQIIVINFNLDRIKQTLDPGNWQLSLMSGSVATPQYFTLIDDSGQNISTSTGRQGRIFNIVSGSIAGGAVSPTATYGLLYPDMGIMILDPVALAASMSIFCSGSLSNTNESNHVKFLRAISGSFSNGAAGFIARNSEKITSTHYFVRVKNQAFNFSNNPTFVTGSLGDFYNQDMVKNPTVYITTVGLYNDNNELLAVAKLSQPLKKTFNNEALIRVKLDY